MRVDFTRQYTKYTTGNIEFYLKSYLHQSILLHCLLSKKWYSFHSRSNAYLRSLQATLQSKTKAELNAGDNKLRVVALKLTNNLHLLIRDLFKKPPAFKAIVGLSWISPNAGSPGAKRPLAYEEDVGSAGGKRRGGQEPYRPPRGKFSERAGAPPAMRGRGRRFWRLWESGVICARDLGWVRWQVSREKGKSVSSWWGKLLACGWSEQLSVYVRGQLDPADNFR